MFVCLIIVCVNGVPAVTHTSMREMASLFRGCVHVQLFVERLIKNTGQHSQANVDHQPSDSG